MPLQCVKLENGQYMAKITGKNNEPLMNSESLKDKASVYENLLAVMQEFSAGYFNFSQVDVHHIKAITQDVRLKKKK